MNSLKLIVFIILIQFIFLKSIICHIESSEQSCGERPTDIRISRIIGGVDTFYGEVPWQVLLHVKVNDVIMQCGAVLIHKYWILTAAHCLDVNGRHYLKIEAYFGKHKFSDTDIESEASHHSKDKENSTKSASIKPLNNSEEPFVSRNASKIIINEHFDSKTLENDIALIKLNQSITNEDNIQPICLPKIMEDFSGQSAYISGFGVLKYGSKQVPQILQIVSVPILTKDYCNYLFEKLGHKNVLKLGKLCAGDIDGGKDACAGDSGGPLAVKRSVDNKWVLAGIISNGIECGQPNTPGVYTQVSAYVDWINTVINSEA